MKQFLNVQSKEKPKIKELSYNVLYIRDNISKKFDEDLNEEIYVYNEIQYEDDEIIEYIDEKLNENEIKFTDLELENLETKQILSEFDLKFLELEGGNKNGNEIK